MIQLFGFVFCQNKLFPFMSEASFYQQAPVWIWNKIEGKVRLTKEKKDAYFGQQIVLQNTVSTSEIKEDSKLSVLIEAKGSLQYDNDQGWKWHKSWNLPDIKVTMNIETSLSQTCLPPKQTFIEIFQVKQDGSKDWESVGMRGQSKIQNLNGQVEFGKGLKLSQTSYGHQGSRFYLVIAAYILDGDLTKSIFSYASPSIFVDSRKSDREFKLQRELNFTDLFCPEILQKSLHKQILLQDQIEIVNSTEGFYNFITASNLRNKIKHPVYLAIKFSSVFQLMCKQEIISDRQLLKLLVQLQTNLVYGEYHFQEADDSLILMVQSFKSFKRNRKLNESLKHLSTLLTVVRDDRSSFQNLENYNAISADQLQRVYSSNQIRLQTTVRMAKTRVYKLKETKDIDPSKSQQIAEKEMDQKQVKIESVEADSSVIMQQQMHSNFQCNDQNLQYLAYYLQQLSSHQLYIQSSQQLNNTPYFSQT